MGRECSSVHGHDSLLTNEHAQIGDASPKGVNGLLPAEMAQYLPGFSRVLNVEYRLSQGPPLRIENPFPAALMDATTAYAYLVRDLGFKPQALAAVEQIIATYRAAETSPMTDEERTALVARDQVALFRMGAHPFLTLTLFIAVFERDNTEPLEYQKAYGASLAEFTLPYPDIAT